MSLEESLGVAAAGAIAGGTGGLLGFGAVLDGIEHGIKQVEVTAETAGQLHVELEKLVSFYNALSGLHDTLLTRARALSDQASAQHGENAGGAVAGARAAWDAIAQSAGADRSRASLWAHIQQVDALILDHMASVQHNVQQYAAHENRTIAGFGKVATLADDAGGEATASVPAGASGKVHWA